MKSQTYKEVEEAIKTIKYLQTIGIIKRTLYKKEHPQYTDCVLQESVLLLESVKEALEFSETTGQSEWG